MGENMEYIKYTKKEVINTLYDNLPSVATYLKSRKLPQNKYIDLALKYNYPHYRICTLADLATLKLMKSFTDNQKQFFNENGEFIVVFNEIASKPVSIIIRSLKQKQFIDYSSFYCMYGIDLLNPDFKYGDWVILTEGIYDADSFRFIYNNILAMLTSNITLMQAEILSTLTDKFILAFDNDMGGKIGVDIAIKRLRDLNPKCKIENVVLYSTDKDIGTMEEKIDNYSEYNYRRTYYQSMIDITIGVGGFML
jgi:DNA primase